MLKSLKHKLMRFLLASCFPTKSTKPPVSFSFPEKYAKGSSSKHSCKLPTFRELVHLPTSPTNFSRVTSPGNLSCQLSKFYCFSTVQVLLHLRACPSNFSSVASPANLSCQLFGCHFTILKTQTTLSFAPSLLESLFFLLFCGGCTLKLVILQPELRERASHTTFVAESCDSRAGAHARSPAEAFTRQPADFK